MVGSSKKIVLVLGGIIFLAAASLGIYLLKSAANSFCQRTDIGTTVSPDGKKEVIIFMYGCGPTVDLSIHASVVNTYEPIDKTASGNALRIDSNHGQAWPRDDQGRPIIRAVWDSSNSVTLNY